MSRTLLLFLMLLMPALAVRAGDLADFAIPVIGRPSDVPFSEAAGKFEVSVRAEPTTVQAEQPLLFTLHVEAMPDPKCQVWLPPQRLDLSKLPAFDERFYIDDPQTDTYNPARHVWEFFYRLKPRRLDVKEVPSVPFVYFDPTINPESKGFQRRLTDEIPLQVTAPEIVQPGPRPVPDLFLQTQTGPSLLAHREPWSLPSLPLLLALVLLPPLGSAGWYILWRRLYPDAARLLKQRRSRAAKVALKQLKRLPRGSTEERAAHIAAAVATYLQQRLDLQAAEPTPSEAANHLRTAGWPDALAKRTEQFFQSCDAARFFPNATAGDLPVSAQQLIHDLEAHTWASRPS